ncbi:hypothetical protein WCE55_00020 [Luteimonas sp. MJ293]|uniref:hypothetical protein n=1 Tax=Luteimonas sp. MJ146 TaxID=3129240 RepID=UPI0031BBBB98
MPLFLALCFLGVTIGGLTAFVIFWPLSLVHLRDRHPALREQLGEGAFLKPSALRWLLSGEYRQSPDRDFTGLATPARIALFTTLFGIVSTAVSLYWALA